MLELWLAVSTTCFWVSANYTLREVANPTPFQIEYVQQKLSASAEGVCKPTVEISTFSPIQKQGVTVYKGSQVQPHLHEWTNGIYPCQDLKLGKDSWRTAWTPCEWDEICRACGKRRRKVTTEEWSEEGQ